MKRIKELYLSVFFLIMAYWSHIHWYCWIPVLAGSIVFGGYVRKEAEQKRRRIEKLETGCFYQEQLIRSFKRSKKIPQALADTLQVSDGELWVLISQALEQIEHGWVKEGYVQEALGIVEAEFGSELMGRLHRFLIHVEEWGGCSDGALDLLLVQLNCWKTWRQQVEIRLGEQLKKLNLTVILSGIICLSITRVIPEEYKNTSSVFYQVSMTVCILVYIGISFFYSWKTNKRISESNETHVTSYEKLWACVTGKKHGISYERAKARLECDVRKYFPEWLMDMLLRLQTENVVSAIMHSIETAPEGLVIPLCKLDRDQKLDALSKQPFLDFLKELNLPEIKALMLQLYAIRNLGKQEIQEEILIMLDQGLLMEETARKLKLEDVLSWNGLMAALPMMVSVIMMILHMSYTLALFLSQISGGGWI